MSKDFVFLASWLDFTRGLTETERLMLIGAIVDYKVNKTKPTSCIKTLFNKIKGALDKELESNQLEIQKPKTTKSYEEQCEELTKQILAYKNQYPPQMLSEFYNYWSEPTRGGKARYFCEKSWEVGRRLSRWAKNNYGSRYNSVSAKERANQRAAENFARGVETFMGESLLNPYDVAK